MFLFGSVLSCLYPVDCQDYRVQIDLPECDQRSTLCLYKDRVNLKKPFCSCKAGYEGGTATSINCSRIVCPELTRLPDFSPNAYPMKPDPVPPLYHVRVECRPGWQIDPLNMHAVCQADAVWNKPLPNCTDINECVPMNNNCTRLHGARSVCTNTPGSFSCACQDGYRMTDSGMCTEILCPGESRVANGAAHYSFQNPLAIGARRVLTCDAGYVHRPAGSNGTSECTPRGQWSDVSCIPAPPAETSPTATTDLSLGAATGNSSGDDPWKGGSEGKQDAGDFALGQYSAAIVGVCGVVLLMVGFVVGRTGLCSGWISHTVKQTVRNKQELIATTAALQVQSMAMSACDCDEATHPEMTQSSSTTIQLPFHLQCSLTSKDSPPASCSVSSMHTPPPLDDQRKDAQQ
eukprot:scpid45200/ scgid10119/ 